MSQKKLTIREEANALTCCAFRNSYLEELHSGKYSEVLEDSKLSRITNSEMKKLMMETSAKVAELLEMKEKVPEQYWKTIEWFHENYTKKWAKE